MKKVYPVFLIILCGLLSMNYAEAGTIKVGGQGRYVMWDSGIAKMNAQAIENQLRKEMDQGVVGLSEFSSFSGLEVGDPEIKGTIFGPQISYETDDKNWEFNASMMLIGSYSTSVDTSVNVTGTFPFVGSVTTPMTIKTDFEIDYKDIDLRASRMIIDNLSIFAGYIYQSYTSKFEANYQFQFSTLSMGSALNFSLDAYMHMLYGGVSYKKPLNSMFTVKGDLGIGTPVAGKVEQEMKISGSFFNNDIKNNGGEVKSALMMFGELNLIINIMENINLDLGYQYRRLNVKVEKLDLNADGLANESKSETDIFHGVKIAATYNFNI